ncbi:MAG TPA: cytochrome c3 family protein [Thermoleophilia bacterium]|nr:cytochrome c3 family protein [Thermoleophilia bacterium]
MFVPRLRSVLPFLLVASTVAALIVLSGCTQADTSATTAATETTATTAGGGTTETTATTAGGGSGSTTATTGGAESVQPVSEAFKVCTECHSDFNQFLATSKVLTKNFGHALHLNKGFKCEDCHAVPTHQPDKIAKPVMQACFVCHSQEPGGSAPGSCSTCHPADFPLVPANHTAGGWLPGPNPGVVKVVSAKHAALAKEDRSYCDTCHAASFCDACHKTPMPHAADWEATHPETVKTKGESSCTTCHPAQYLCNDCHHTGYKPGDTPWRLQHPPIVKSAGAESCFKCHNPLTCEHCHITGELDMNLKPTG